MLRRRKLRVFCLLVSVQLLTASCAIVAAEDPSCEDSRFEEFAEMLYERGEFEKLYELSLPCAEAGDPEMQFGVGLLIGATGEEQIGDFGESERQQVALSWFRRAAVKGHLEARNLLADSYIHGWYGLPEDEDLASCWRSTVTDGSPIEMCLEKEDNLEG